ncbi:class A sortase [Mammaliicoccus stepanovicii]|uniref:Sortase n=1 Tax=Mammaliicoccus stepanovicii TaxID=643214 RepID=A0A239ZJ12_9STAP|nr:class A sortase [Mammaliicoccus stepanovicii]PNZ77970.1 class A sortase SrtA [Mammaliicoccus stepanovicii]GGI41729.1 class A sortase SrtA [Mammaliicoccus stepanovicii]SNV70869.1 sortase [Mammaliicoccus stepanovicii]
MRWVLRIIGLLLIITAITIFFWNDIRTYVTDRVNDKVITSFENKEDKVDINPVESFITKTDTKQIKLGDNMVGYLKVPAADINEPIFNGPATEQNLKNGLSLVDEGEKLSEQNVAIAGHRVEGAGIRFNYLDRAKIGDKVELITLNGTKTYKIKTIKNVKPTQVEVLNEHKGKPNQLTLITCDTYNPETLLFEERMIYTAVEEKSA